MDEIRSYSTHTSKIITSLADIEEDDDDGEEIFVFSTGRIESGGESESCAEEEELESLGSFAEYQHSNVSPQNSESKLGDSLKDLPYEPSIAQL